ANESGFDMRCPRAEGYSGHTVSCQGTGVPACWRTATAVLLPDDDVVARTRSFAPHPLLAPLARGMFAVLESDPVTVRITFTDN
ncbi:hypothetical protein ACWELQ_39490, partial [Nocardia sp. NPDC004722]